MSSIASCTIMHHQAHSFQSACMYSVLVLCCFPLWKNVCVAWLQGSQRVIQSRGSRVPDIVAMLHELCEKMEGRISSGFTIHQHTIRCGALQRRGACFNAMNGATLGQCLRCTSTRPCAMLSAAFPMSIRRAFFPEHQRETPRGGLWTPVAVVMVWVGLCAVHWRVTFI